MTSIGSNIASTSGGDSSEGPPACEWLSLTLEEQLTNLNRNFQRQPYHDLGELGFIELFERVVKELRYHPLKDVERLLHYHPSLAHDFYGTTPLHWAVLMDDRTMVQDILISGRVRINAVTRVGNATALHYAVIDGNCDIVEDLLKYKADVCICDVKKNSALYYMVKKKDSFFGILKAILARNINMQDGQKNTTLHHAVQLEAVDVMTYLLDVKANVNVRNNSGSTPLHCSVNKGFLGGVQCLMQYKAYVHVKDNEDNNALHLAIQAYGRKHNMEMIKLLQKCDVDANAKNKKGYSPFFAAIAQGHVELVKELLQSKEKIKLMEERCNGQTAIEIAFGNGYEHIKRAFLECDDISRYVNDLYRDREVYVDAANAILVGAALIAGVTFASWLQPPLGYTTSYSDLVPSSSNINYVDIEHNVPLRAFWVFNTLSFYFAIATVVFGARSVLPRGKMFIKKIVVKLQHNLLVTSILLACSVFFVIIAFGIAGFIVLTPTLKFQWYMIVPTIFGGLVCVVSLGFLFKSVVEDNLEKKRKPLELF